MKVHRFFGSVLLVLSLFPYVGLKFLDTQPWPILAAVLFCLFSLIGRRLPSVDFDIIFLGFVSVFGVIFAFAVSNREDYFLLARGIFGYISIPIFYVAYSRMLSNQMDELKYLVSTNILWVAGGLVQLLFGAQIFDFMVLSRTTDGRGLTSFSNEPTFFGYMLLFYSTYYYLDSRCDGPAFSFLILINLVCIAFLAQSSICLALVVIFFATKILSTFRIIRVFQLGFVVYLFFQIIDYFEYFIGPARLSSVVRIVLSDPFMLFSLDASANSRLADFVIPLAVSFKENWLLPGGFNTIGKATGMHIHELFGDYFFYETGGAKIMSYMGAVIYELGFFGLLVIIILSKYIIFRLRGDVALKVGFLLLLVSSVPIAFPPLYLLLAKIRGVVIDRESMSYK